MCVASFVTSGFVRKRSSVSGSSTKRYGWHVLSRMFTQKDWLIGVPSRSVPERPTKCWCFSPRMLTMPIDVPISSRMVAAKPFSAGFCGRYAFSVSRKTSATISSSAVGLL